MLHYSFFSSIALVLGISSIVLLYRIWKRRKGDPRVNLLTKLAAAAAAIMCSMLLAQDVGAELAVTFSFLLFSIAAWLCVLWECYRKGDWRQLLSQSTTTRSARSDKTRATASQKWLTLNAVLVAGPLSGMAAALVSLALTHFAGLNHANQFVLSGFLFLILWCAMAIWACADTLWWRPVLASLSSMTLAYLVIQL